MAIEIFVNMTERKITTGSQEQEVTCYAIVKRRIFFILVLSGRKSFEVMVTNKGLKVLKLEMMTGNKVIKILKIHLSEIWSKLQENDKSLSSRIG